MGFSKKGLVRKEVRLPAYRAGGKMTYYHKCKGEKLKLHKNGVMQYGVIFIDLFFMILSELLYAFVRICQYYYYSKSIKAFLNLLLFFTSYSYLLIFPLPPTLHAINYSISVCFVEQTGSHRRWRACTSCLSLFNPEYTQENTEKRKQSATYCRDKSALRQLQELHVLQFLVYK